MSGKLTRRTLLHTVTGAAAMAAVSSRVAFSTDAQSPANSRIKHSACKWCYGNIPLEELAIAGKKIGLSSIELLGPEDWPVLQKHGLTCAMANGPARIPDGFNRVENHSWLVPQYNEYIPLVAKAGLPNVITFSGNRNGLDDEQGLENCVVGLKQIMKTAEQHKVTVCMELLNSKVDHPDYQCDHTAWGVELVKRVGSERFKLLYDIYHMQIMEGDIIRTIRENHEYIGHYHTGGNPGRNEIDDTQELYYPAIMRAIADTGFQGYVAQEFVPRRDPLTSLEEAIKICSV
jgi:hydroxypyruvate isomerase